MDDLLWFLLDVGALAFALGLGLAYWLRPTSILRISAFLLCGLLLAGGLFFWYFINAPTDGYPEACSDCSEWYGRYYEPDYVTFLSILNLGGWLLGSLFGLAARGVTGGQFALSDDER